MKVEELQRLVTELKASIVIDKHDLDSALIEQAELLFHTGQLQAAWVAERDRKKLALQRLEARLDKELREAAEAAKDKITEKEIARTLDLDKDVMELQDQLVEDNAQLMELEKLWDSYKDRRHTLRGLVDLYTSNYYADPSAGTSVKTRAAAEARQHLAVERRKLKR